jgi:hypothetical protein
MSLLKAHKHNRTSTSHEDGKAISLTMDTLIKLRKDNLQMMVAQMHSKDGEG